MLRPIISRFVAVVADVLAPTRQSGQKLPAGCEERARESISLQFLRSVSVRLKLLLVVLDVLHKPP